MSLVIPFPPCDSSRRVDCPSRGGSAGAVKTVGGGGTLFRPSFLSRWISREEEERESDPPDRNLLVKVFTRSAKRGVSSSQNPGSRRRRALPHRSCERRNGMVGPSIPTTSQPRDERSIRRTRIASEIPAPAKAAYVNELTRIRTGSLSGSPADSPRTTWTN